MEPWAKLKMGKKVSRDWLATALTVQAHLTHPNLNFVTFEICFLLTL